MKHPFDFIPNERRKPLFFMFLALTLVLFAVFRVLDKPLHTQEAPNGIVSFELAGTVRQARAITNSWKYSTLAVSDIAGQPNPDAVNIPYAFASFGLGLDYLFMPIYAVALALATLLAAGRHKGWFMSFGAVAGWGAFGAALFDAVENYALFRVLLGYVVSPYPEVAALCASVKFFLIILGILYCLVGWVLPKQA